MNVVDLKNIVLLVTKKIWSSVNLQCKIMSQSPRNYVQTNCGSVVRLEVFLLSVPIRTLLTCSHCVPMIFPQSTQRCTLYYFRRIYTILLTASFLLQWFVYPPILRMCRWYIFSSQRVCTTFAGETEIIEENINFYRSISRFISLVFLSTSVTLNILSLYQLSLDFENFSMSLLGHFRFWAHTLFPEIICPRYGLGGIIFLKGTAPQCDLQKWVSNDWPYLSRHLQATSIISLFLFY